MLDLEPNRVFIIQVHAPGLDSPADELAVGKNVDRAVLDIKERYPDYKRIIVFDAETKDAVRVFKKQL